MSGDSGFEQTLLLSAGESVAVTVPGTLEEASVPIGSLPGGYRYIVREGTPPSGAVVTVDPDLVVVNQGPNTAITVTNTFGAPPPPLAADLDIVKCQPLQCHDRNERRLHGRGHERGA